MVTKHGNGITITILIALPLRLHGTKQGISVFVCNGTPYNFVKSHNQQMCQSNIYNNYFKWFTDEKLFMGHFYFFVLKVTKSKITLISDVNLINLS